MTRIPEAVEKRILFKLSQRKQSYGEIAAEVGYSATTVLRVASRFGLKRDNLNSRIWTDDEVKSAHDYIKQGLTYAEVGKHLGRSLHAVRHKMADMPPPRINIAEVAKGLRQPTSDIFFEQRSKTGNASDIMGARVEGLIAKMASRERVSEAAVRHFLGWKHAA